MLYLAGLKDDYEHDGRVITEIVTRPGHALSAPGVTALGACYKQLNSSVGEFGTATPAGGDRCDREQQPGDASYLRTDKALSALKRARDRLAGEIKGELDAAAFSGTGVHDAAGQTLACRALISSAERLATGH